MIIKFFTSRIRKSNKKTMPNLVSGFTPTPSFVSLCSVLDGFLNKLTYIKKSFLKTFINGTTKTQHKIWCRGFTLVETMVAVMILSVTIVSLMTVVSNSLFAARYAKDEITAGYLLQEVIDYIRNDRDTKVFLVNAPNINAAWNTFKTKYNLCSGDGCYFNVIGTSETPSITITKCPNGVSTCRDLYYDGLAVNSPYYVNENTSTNGKIRSGYQRKIVVESNNDEMIVTVTVFWKNGGLSKSRVLTTSLLKWQS